MGGTTRSIRRITICIFFMCIFMFLFVAKLWKFKENNTEIHRQVATLKSDMKSLQNEMLRCCKDGEL